MHKMLKIFKPEAMKDLILQKQQGSQTMMYCHIYKYNEWIKKKSTITRTRG